MPSGYTEYLSIDLCNLCGRSFLVEYQVDKMKTYFELCSYGLMSIIGQDLQSTAGSADKTWYK